MLNVLNHRDTTPRHHVPAGKKQFPGKGSQTGYPPCAKEIVEMFHEHGNKMGVPDMRKNMKTLVAEIFFEDKYSAIHKCRGIWKEKPSDWDAEIPFCDPNNAEHPHIDQRKPSKKTLATMMKYLVYKFEEKQRSGENQRAIKKLEDLSLEEPPRASLKGGIITQPSDAPEQLKQELDWQKSNEVKEEKSSIEICDQNEYIFQNHWMQSRIDTNSIATMENGTVRQPVQEESDILGDLMDQFDLIPYIDSEPTITDNCIIESAPANGSVQEEVGNFPEMNFNVQTKSNDMQLVWESQAPVKQTFAPPQEPAPVKNEVEGLVISNSGQLVTSHTTAAFSGGENQEDDIAEVMEISGLILHEIDPNQIDDVFKAVNPNLVIGTPNQPMMGNSNQAMMESSDQVMMETFILDMIKTEGPMEEMAVGSFAVQEMNAFDDDN